MTVSALAPSGARERWGRPLALGLTLLCVAVFVFFFIVQASDPRYGILLGIDRQTYREAGLRVLSGGSWFFPEQVTGQPYTVVIGHIMYPPVAMLWLVPAALLPDVVWWGLPLVVIGAVVVHHRPAPWGWVAMGICLTIPTTSQVVIVGNPGLWIAAAIAVGTIWRPAFALVFLKPSLFPFALLGVRSRGWWVLTAAGAVVSLLMLPLTLQWFGVILNARGWFSGPLYSLRDVPLMLIPVIAGIGSRSRGAGRQCPDLEVAELDARSISEQPDGLSGHRI